MNENSISELMCAFLDGELEGPEAEALFSMLAHNHELQMEMRRLIALNTGFRKELLPPPEYLRTAVEQKVWGLPSPGNSPLAAVLKSRPFLMLVSAACAVLLTLQFTDSSAGSRRTVASTAVNPAMVVPHAEVPVVSTTAIREGRAQKAGTKGRHDRTPTMPAEALHAEQTASELQSNNSAPAVPAVDISSAAALPPPVTIEATGVVQTAELGETASTSVPADDGNTYNERAFALHLRGFAARSFPDPDVAPLIVPALNNIGIGLSYSIAGEHRLGVEVGQENLLQRYYNEEGPARVTIEQNYLAFWAGATYRYSPDLGWPLRPYMQTFIGGTRTGPMARSALGVEYRAGNIGIGAGVEGTVHVSRYRGTWYSTRKLGINYSLSFHF